MSDEQQKIIGARRRGQYMSARYQLTQMLSALLSINMILPAVLKISWTGTSLQQGLFMFVYAIFFLIATLLFLALFAYLSVVLEVAKHLRKLKLEDVRNTNLARALAVRVLIGNQPRWLISLIPCVVPAATLAASLPIFHDQFPVDDFAVLAQACLLHGLTSFILCLPFTLKAQRTFNAGIINKEGQPPAI